ncbi:MAG TPA: GHMP kinase [Kiritimatiellia bacterium]|nr:GHMP kinase [Kiritimatiellia bacterium]
MKKPRKAPKRNPQPAVLVEVAEFERRLRLGAGDPEGVADFFAQRPIWAARVPARLDVMGGIADYSGANVCEGTLGAGVLVAVQPRQDRLVRIRSVSLAPRRLPVETRFPLGWLESRGKPVSYGEVRALFRENHLAAWAAYAAGSLFTLLKEEKLRLRGGFDVLIFSTVPMNAGVASSAAVEIGTLCAFDACLDLGLEPARIARLGQIAENRVVGAPCGIMDQIAIASGRRGQLVHILCRPGAVVDAVEIPPGTGFVGINSMVRHSVAAAPYGDVRIGAFMGKRILNDLRARDGLPAVKHLTEISDKEFAARSRHLPETLKGAEFLQRYGSHGDAATTIRPGTLYRVRGPARHAVRENERVLRFIAALRRGGEAGCVAAGREMYGAHASYRDECRLSVPEVDALVAAVRRRGAKKGLYGAKITGGGAGGTVAVFGRLDALEKHVPAIAREHARRFGVAPEIYRGTSPGALEFGARRYKPFMGDWACLRMA